MRPPARRTLLGTLLSLTVLVTAAPPPASAAGQATSAAVPSARSAATAGSASAAPPSPFRRGFGAVPLTKRVPASTFVRASARAAGKQAMALPVAVDLSADAPAIGDQGQVGSCVAWAIGHSVLGYYSRTQPHAGAPFAPLSLYNVINGGRDAGSTSSNAYAALRTRGITEKSAWTHGPTDYLSQPNTVEAANALGHLTSGGSYLFVGENQGTTGQTAIQTALAAGTPLAVGIPVHQPFMGLNSTSPVMSLSKATGSVLGYHMVAAYGYDATGVKIANSWGTGWGRSGWATLGWDYVRRHVMEASAPGAFATATANGVPTVTEVTPKVALAGAGGTVVVKGTNLAQLVQGTGVQLVDTQDASRRHSVAVTTAGGSAITATLPAGAPPGSYRVVVTNTYGANADTPADDVSLVARPAFTVAAGTTVPASSGGAVTLTGTGFGTSAAAFAALGYTATVAGKAAKLAWVSDTAVTVAFPAGVPGGAPSVVLTRAGHSSTPSTVARYGANIATATSTVDALGPVLRVSGKGFTGSTGWTLTSVADSSRTTSLPVTTDPRTVGVVLAGDTGATVRLPAAPGAAGTYRLSFTPSTGAYPGAVFADTPAARYTYKVPTLTGSSTTRASTAGGTRVVLKGTGLLAVDPAAGTVTVAPVADPTRTATVTVDARTDTTLTLTLPASALVAGARLEGDHRIVVGTPLGAATTTDDSDVVRYVSPYAVSVQAGTKVPAVGGTLTVLGAGFGSTRAEFTTAKITATVNGRTAPVSWASDSAVRVAVPAGVPGADASVVLLRQGVASPAIVLPYVATVSSLSAIWGPSSGGTVVTVTGKGFTGATWSVTRADGSLVAALPAVGSLDGVASGVVAVSDTRVLVRMPASPSPFLPVVVGFTPDQGRYPGAVFGATAKAVFTYADLG